MKYYSEWQDALIDWIKLRGHSYEKVSDLFALMSEFENNLGRNSKGAYYLIRSNK